MILEIAMLPITPGMEEDFHAAMLNKGNACLAACPGVYSVRIMRGVENPGKFMLMLEWESTDAHKEAVKTPPFAEFRAIIAPFTASGGGSMEHFRF